MTGACRNKSYKNKNTLSGTFKHLRECIEVIMTVDVPAKVQIRKKRQVAKEETHHFTAF